MRITHTISEAREAVSAARAEGKSIGFVPTMGALHEGHLTLVRHARAPLFRDLSEAERNGNPETGRYIVASIFVNPTQFGPTEDLDRYPRNLDLDAALCEAENVDLIFAPTPREMYPDGFDSWVDVGGLTEPFEGAIRPGHFRGVTTVCAKLFSIVRPDRVYMGMKDYQQLKVIQKMVRDLNLPLEIVPVETVREPDGLALSSRNAYLTPEERKSGLVLSKSLAHAQSLFAAGERQSKSVQESVVNLIKAEPAVVPDYIAVVDAETLQPIDTIDRDAVVLLAARVGKTRLIDNTVLRVADARKGAS